MTMPSEATASHAAVREDSQTVIAFGETLVDQFRDRNVLGGAPFNVACHLGALGAHPVLVTRAGKDALGDQLLQAMGERGLDMRGVQRAPARPTGRVKVTETARGHACEFLDVNLRDPWVDADTLRWALQQARVAKLNEDELVRIGDLFSLDGATPQARAAVLLSGFDLQRLVVTCGAGGAWTLDAAGRIESVTGTQLSQVVDTVGAGDGFAAVFMLGMLRGWLETKQLARADAFARALCGLRGAVPASQYFYRPFIRDWRLESEVMRA